MILQEKELFMKMRGINRIKFAFLAAIMLLALPLAGCASDEADTDVDFRIGEKVVDWGTTSQQANTADKKTMRLGSSLYAVQTPWEYYPVRVTNAEWEDDIMARYRNAVTLTDFAVYQFSKEGCAAELEAFTREEAEKYEASEVVTGIDLNGIPAAYYRSVEEYLGDYYDGITFALDAEEEYLELDFRFTSDLSEDEAWEIARSLKKVGVEPLSLGQYTIEIPVEFILSSDKNANPVVFKSGSSSLYLYIGFSPASGNTLSTFALGSGGSDVETDQEINGIPVAYYRSVEALDGAYRSVLTCVLPEGEPNAPDGFITLAFRLDGISADAEAANILKSLAKVSDRDDAK